MPLTLLTTIKQGIPILIVLAAIVLSVVFPPDFDMQNRAVRPLYTLAWFFLGGAMGAWIFREAYKGGPDKMTRKAIQKRQEALTSARNFLQSEQPRLAYQTLAPYLREDRVSDIHFYAVRALLRSSRLAQAKELLYDSLEGIREQPSDRFRQWEAVFSECGETNIYFEIARTKFEATPDSLLLDRIMEHSRGGGHYDQILEWGDGFLSDSELPEDVLITLKQRMLQAIYETCTANNRLSLPEQSINLLEQYEPFFSTEAIWHQLYSQSLVLQGDIERGLEVALNGYRITANPILLLEGFGVLAIDKEPAVAVTRFLEWVDIFPDDGVYRFFVGWVLYHIGLFQEALPHLRASLQHEGLHTYFALMVSSMIENEVKNLHQSIDLAHQANNWLRRVPFLWECGTCGTISAEPNQTCSRCGAWNQASIVPIPAGADSTG